MVFGTKAQEYEEGGNTNLIKSRINPEYIIIAKETRLIKDQHFEGNAENIFLRGIKCHS